MCKIKPRQILFICTGNYYRSRFAELFFNHLAVEQNLNWISFSRGFNTLNNTNQGPISSFTRKALAERKIKLPPMLRYPLRLRKHDLLLADKIIAMKADEHVNYFERHFPQWTDKTTFWKIDDLDMASAEEAIPKLEAQLIKLAEELKATE